MTRTHHSNPRAVTLPEVLVAITILAIIGGSIAAIYQASMQTWYRGAAEAYAEQKATMAVKRMIPDLQTGMAVTAASSPYDSVCIAVRLPEKVYDGASGVYLNRIETDTDGRPYLVQGNFVVYFRGDAAGNIATDGDRIWRRVVKADTGEIITEQLLADHVVDNPALADGTPQPTFKYWPDIYRLRSVEVTVTVQEEFGHRTATKTMNGELTLRNN